MSKHTPGPWIEARRSKSTVLKDIYVNKGCERIARVVVPQTAHDIDEYEANARLIAAAPELMAALQVMLRDYTAVYDIGDVEMQPAIYQARAAIAKATGETQ